MVPEARELGAVTLKLERWLGNMTDISLQEILGALVLWWRNQPHRARWDVFMSDE